MKSNNNKSIDIEAQTFENDTAILSNTTITRNVKMISAFLLFQAIIVLSMLFMFSDTVTNDSQYHPHGRTPLAEPMSVHADPSYQQHDLPKSPSKTDCSTSGPFHRRSTAEKCCGSDNVIEYVAVQGKLFGTTQKYRKYRCKPSKQASGGQTDDEMGQTDDEMDALSEEYNPNHEMDIVSPVVQFEPDVSLVFLSDFEYDDIVFISAFLMDAAERLGKDPMNPTLDSIIDNVQIAYFAQDHPKKDGNGLWLKKLKVAQKFFPPQVYSKIVIRWRNNRIPEYYQQLMQLHKSTTSDPDDMNTFTPDPEIAQLLVEYYDAKTFVRNMKKYVDMIVICGGQGNLVELDDQMDVQEKKVHRMIMSVGGVNIREDQTDEREMPVLFGWGEQSEQSGLGYFVDSSRFTWMGLANPGQLHALGGKQEMERLLRDFGRYEIVMEYLTAFNLGMIYGEDDQLEALNNEDVTAYRKLLREKGFDRESFVTLCLAIINDKTIRNYYEGSGDKKEDPNWDLNTMDAEDSNWNLGGMDNAQVWKAHKMKKVLAYLAGKTQDGAAADPVIAYWHLFPFHNKIVHGHMMKDCEFDDEEKGRYELVKGNTGLRQMVTNEVFEQIKAVKSECNSRGPIVQIWMKTQYATPDEFLSHYSGFWRFMFTKALNFHNVKPAQIEGGK